MPQHTAEAKDLGAAGEHIMHIWGKASSQQQQHGAVWARGKAIFYGFSPYILMCVKNLSNYYRCLVSGFFALVEPQKTAIMLFCLHSDEEKISFYCFGERNFCHLEFNSIDHGEGVITHESRIYVILPPHISTVIAISEKHFMLKMIFRNNLWKLKNWKTFAFGNGECNNEWMRNCSVILFA